MKQRIATRIVLGLPLLWLLLFVLVPVLILAMVSLSESQVGIPPYKPLLNWSEDGQAALAASLNSYVQLAEDGMLAQSLQESLTLAGLTTLICLVVGWPMAWAIARARREQRGPLLLLIMLPFWTSFLVRIYAWMTILGDDGLLNNFLLWLGLIDQPWAIMNTDKAILIGMVYAYLPFMVLPLFAVLERIDQSLLEASADLGAGPARTFLSVLLPLSMPGILAGSALVFVPALGEYVIPEMMGGGGSAMMGKMLWDVFALTRDWPAAAALAMALLAVVAVPLVFLQRARHRLAGRDS
ncbi:MAG: ABC transporter permease subunit [Alphaproteobacteria bacterium]|nr:ABC transporter permease subunit [Alphaproteobacteria bacterium]